MKYFKVFWELGLERAGGREVCSSWYCKAEKDRHLPAADEQSLVVLRQESSSLPFVFAGQELSSFELRLHPWVTTKAYRELRITSWLCLVHFAVIADRTISLLHPGLHSSHLVKLFLRKVFSSHPSWEQTVKADNGKFSIFGISHLMLLWKVNLENITE